MTVAEMIAWLQTQPPDAEVAIHDADTGWFLRAHAGPNRDPYNSKSVPIGCVAISGDYGDRLDDGR